MLAKVISITKNRKGGYSLPDDVMNDIRYRMHAYEVADLAELAGVSKGTIYSIRSGRTKWPRGTTLFPILDALGLDLVLVDRATGKPIR